MTARHLIVFTRFPVPGITKTRLIPALGAEGAAELQREMTRHTLAAARQLAAEGRVSVEVRFEGADVRQMGAYFGNDVVYRPQGPGNLGCRMQRAFAEACRAGIERIVIIGADCPGVTPELVRQAFDRLANSDVVLGPASDGGYYLIGLQRPIPGLFAQIPWGSGRVLEETLRRADELALGVFLLRTLSDVDRPEDLGVWHRARRSSPSPSAARISVIIPTLNEADSLPHALAGLRGAEDLEGIVVDGGSHDGTTAIAEREGFQTLSSPPCRAIQMNAGARASSGSILIFLHADTRLAPGFDSAVRAALAEPGVAGGAFRLRIGAPGVSLRIIEWAANVRARLFWMPYGDQGLFCRRATFEELGGFAALPIMEDFEFVRRLRCRGRIRIAPIPARTSGRRWQALGPWSTTWINQKVILGYYLGVAPERLAEWYARRPG